MKTNQLLAIARTAADNLVKLIEENQEEILRDIAAVSEEAQNQEADKIVFSLAHAIKINITGKALTDSLSWSVKKKLETTQALPDPDQPELPGLAKAVKGFQGTLKGAGASVVIGFGDKNVEITKDSIKATKK
jgi:hypothetical protein